MMTARHNTQTIPRFHYEIAHLALDGTLPSKADLPLTGGREVA